MTSLLQSDYGAVGKNEVRSLCFDAPAWIHKYIIGQKGLDLFGSSANFPKVLVNFMEDGKIYIDGPLDEVLRAHETLKSKVEFLLSRIPVGDDDTLKSKLNEVTVGNGFPREEYLEEAVGVTDIVKEKNYKTEIHTEGDNYAIANAKKDLEDLVYKMKHFTLHYFNSDLVFEEYEKIHQIRKKYDQVQSTFSNVGAKKGAATLFGRKRVVENNLEGLMKWVKEFGEEEIKDSSTSSQIYYLLIDQRGRIVKSSIEDSGVRAEIQFPSSEKLIDLSRDSTNDKTGPKEKDSEMESRDIDNTSPTEKDSDIEVIVITGREDAVEKMCTCLGIFEEGEKALVDCMIPQSTADSVLDDKEQNFERSMPEVKKLTILQETLQSEIPAAPLDWSVAINGEDDKVDVKSDSNESCDEFGCVEFAIQKIAPSKEHMVSLEKEVCEGTGDVKENVTLEVNLQNKFHRLVFGSMGRVVEEVAEEYGVRILVFPINKRNTIEITGFPSMVEKAKEAIQKKCSQLDEELKGKQLETFKIKVEFDSWYYPIIFQKKSIIIDEIQEKNNVRIYLFKRKKSKCLKMIISGHKEPAIAACNEIMKIVKLETVSEELTVPRRFHRFLIGPRGERIRSIQEECKEVYIIFPSDDINSDTLVINGSREGVEKAKQILKDITNYEQIRVDPKFHGYLIGEHGKRIKKLCKSTGAGIEFPSALDKDKELITLMGSKASLKKAKADIEAALEIKIGRVQDKISMERRVFSDLMRFKAKHIKKTLNKLKVNMISPADESSSEDPIIITLEGIKGNVSSAKMCLLDLSKKYRGFVKEEIHVECAVYSGLTGSEGRQIMAAMKKCGLNVKFPKPDSNVVKTGVVEISGPEEAVIYAKKYLLDFELEYLKNAVNVNLDPDVYPGLIGQKGQKLKRLIKSCGADVIFHKPTSDSVISLIVTIRGSEKAVAESQNLLLDFEKEYLDLDKEEVAIKPFTSSELRGSRGKKIKKEMQKCGVELSFCIPDENSTDDSVVKIIGVRKAVVKAKAILLAFEKRLITSSKEEVEIDPTAYSGFIGKRGEKIRTTMKKKCGVDLIFPKSGLGANIVEIRGTVTGIQKAKSHLLNFVAEYSMSIKEVITFTPEAYSAFTGKRGIHVRKTRKTYGVDVFLSEFSSGDTKTMTAIIEGSMEAVFKAKKHILTFGVQHSKKESGPSNGATNETIYSNDSPAEASASVERSS